MKERASYKSIWFELGALLALLASATLWIPTAQSTAPQDNRQLKREQTQPKGAEQRRIALVMGNGAYQNVKPLKNPPNDAMLLAATLKKLGFQVTIGTDRSQREMKQLIREFGQRLRWGGGVGLFYFAGHGVQARGHNYLIPVDAEIQTEADLEDVAVDVNYVLNMMDDAQNALNIAILDACRNNPFARSFRSAQEGLAHVKAPTGTLIAYATAPDSVAADGSGTNSPYTEELTKQMQTLGVLLETMFRRVTEAVSLRTGGRQEPWYSANVKGDFFFSHGPTNIRVSNSPEKIDAIAVEREYWETIRGSSDAQDYKDYLQTYPIGAYAGVARAKIRQLETVKNRQSTEPQPIDTQPSNSGSNQAGEAKTSAALSKSFKSQLGLEMVYVSPGRFPMGSPNGLADQKPVHEITISQPFYIGKYEVTQWQWQAVMGTTLRQQRDKAKLSGPIVGEGDNYPMYYVSWEEAKSFVQRLNAWKDGNVYRLPTEAEWEYACRASAKEDPVGGLDSMAWYGNNSGNRYIDAASIWLNDQSTYDVQLLSNGGRAHPVGTKQANGLGLHDMHGNVWEWCEDWYHASYESGPNDGSAWLSGGEQLLRTLRGGSWASVSTILRSAFRGWGSPDARDRDIGFRVVAVARTQ